MANIVQEHGLSRAWQTAVAHVGEREVVLTLAVVLPLGALILGLCKGRKHEVPEPRPRKMSFSSGYMSVGTWPKDVKMADPVITAFMFLDRVPEQEDLVRTCAKMLRYHNFRALPHRRRWRLIPPDFSTRFEWRDIEVCPGDVITRVRAKGSAEVLAEMDRIKDANLRQTTAEGRGLPIWGLHVIENVGDAEEGGIGTVAALRVHHSIGDGMSLVSVARSVLETMTGGEIGLGVTGVAASLDGGAKSEKVALSNFTATQILRGIRHVIALSTSGPDTPLPFGHAEGPISHGAAFHGIRRGVFSGRRRTILMPDLPLSVIKKIKNASGSTVNDVMMCLVAGCIRRYSEAKGGTEAFSEAGTAGFKSRVLIPVALPRSMYSSDLCNKWAFVSMKLFVDEADPMARLHLLKATTTEAKSSPTAGLQYMMQSRMMPHLPLFVCREMVHGALATHTVTMSNVPGPQEPVTFAGVRLRKIHFAFSNMMPQVGVVSLDGVVAVNFVVDPHTVPDSETLAAHLVSELEALAEASGTDCAAEISAVKKQVDVYARVTLASTTAAPAEF